MSMEGNYWQNHRVSTDRLIEVCANLNDYVDEPVSPLVTEFARIIAAPWQAWQDDYEVAFRAVPSEMVGNTLNFLELIRTRGQEQQQLLRYVSPNFFNITEDQLRELYFAVPIIMKAAYPLDFAEVIENNWDGVLKYWGYKEDLPNKTVDEIEPVNNPINSVEEAKSIIIDYAREKVVALDWQWALGSDIEADDIPSLFDAIYPRVINRISIAPVLAVFHTTRDSETLSNIPSQQKINLEDHKTLALLFDSINAEVATFIRDQLCIMLPDEIGERLGVDIAAGKLLITNPGLQQAAERSFAYFELGLPAE